MLILILLIAILAGVVYLTMKKDTNKQIKQPCGIEINESTFNPNYKISKDVNGLEVVQSCGR